MTDRELMQQALEALDWAADCIEPRKPSNCDCPVCFASNALRERLAQPETVMAEYKHQTYAAYKSDGEMKIGVVPEQREVEIEFTQWLHPQMGVIPVNPKTPLILKAKLKEST